jgi:uncharacterized Ntn-hydrolase superfamily protein
MKKRFFALCIALLSGTLIIKGQDTFSIVAVDSATGEVGSAGASCLGYTQPVVPYGARIISDVIPGKGAIHTQAFWDPQNQKYADFQLVSGKTPAEIIIALKDNDAGGDSTIRQYGIVELNGGHPRTGAYTGSGCYDYKSHIIGKYYTIQGNTLLGRKVLDSMEYRFLNTKGTLADRLMATLEGAKMIGADTRCNTHNSSSLSAFLRVAKPADDTSKLYIDIHMSYDNNITGNVPVDPIDSLQHMYKRILAGVDPGGDRKLCRLYYIANDPYLDFTGFKDFSRLELRVADMQGKILFVKKISDQTVPVFDGQSYPDGIYIYRVYNRNAEVESGKINFLRH